MSVGRVRARDLAYGSFVAVCLASQIWPTFPIFTAGRSPLLLGLPRALVWIVGWILLSFVALALYDATRGDRA